MFTNIGVKQVFMIAPLKSGILMTTYSLRISLGECHRIKKNMNVTTISTKQS